MSELKLSVSLIQSIQKIIVSEDPQAEDGLITAQYLAAVMGYMVGSRNMETQARREALDELCDFARYVMQDVEGQTPQPKEEAMGVWRPGMP